MSKLDERIKDLFRRLDEDGKRRFLTAFESALQQKPTSAKQKGDTSDD